MLKTTMEAPFIILTHFAIGVLYLLEKSIAHVHVYIGILYVLIAIAGVNAYFRYNGRVKIS